MRAVIVAAAALAATGCLRTTAFPCTTDGECTTGGTCEPVGFCSFLDPSCPSGSRFGDYSGGYANQCTTDVAPDAPGACPATYTRLPDAGPHVYRRITASASWTTQRTACTADNGYLVIPDDAAELTALTALAAGAETWLGITDVAAEGTFLTVRGTPPPFFLWSTGEPNNDPGDADCVRVLANGRYADDRCISGHPAICECDP